MRFQYNCGENGHRRWAGAGRSFSFGPGGFHMRDLFAVGKNLAQGGYQWQKYPPGFEQGRPAIGQ